MADVFDCPVREVKQKIRSACSGSTRPSYVLRQLERRRKRAEERTRLHTRELRVRLEKLAREERERTLAEARLARAERNHEAWYEHEVQRNVWWNVGSDICYAGVRYTAREYKRWAQFDGVRCQSGVPGPSRRALRDAEQRAAARKRSEAKRKQVPKKERERKVQQERDKRSGVVEPQGGSLLPVLAGAAGALVLNKVWTLLSSTEKLIGDASVVMQAFKKAKRLLSEHLGKALWGVPLVMMVYRFLHDKKFGRGIGAATVVLCLTKLLGPVMWGHISEFFPDGNVKPQAGFVDSAPKLLATALTFSVLRGKTSKNNVGELMKRFTMLERCSGGISVFMDWCASAIEAGINFFRELFGKERVELFRSADKPMKEWARSIDKAAVDIATCDAEPSPELLNALVRLIRDGMTFRDLYRGTSVGRFVEEYMVKVNALLMPYTGALNARNNFRFEPDACLFVGEPGIGKTLLAMPFCAAILLRSGLIPKATSFDEVAAEVWQKGTSEFWNSYAGQACVVMDDAFQARTDASDKENEYMTLIRMCSSWSYPLNFADLTSKGKIFFMSKFIFGTTNLDSIRSSAGICVHEPAAVARRINHPYRLVLKPEYKTNGFLDQTKYQEELVKCSSGTGLDFFPWYMWSVRRHDFMTGITSSEDMSLKALVEDIVESLRRKLTTHGASKDYLKGFVAAQMCETVVTPGVRAQAGGSDTAGSVGNFAQRLVGVLKVHHDVLQADVTSFERFLSSFGGLAKAFFLDHGVVHGLEVGLAFVARHI